jgi:beta-RFAP synthase
MARSIEVLAPSRLHFGMLSLQPGCGRQYGGVGAMIQTPGLRLTIREAPRLEAAGPRRRRTLRAARLAWTNDPACPDPAGEPGCRIEVCEAPPQHVGLGTGTQLAMAVAAGLAAFFDRPAVDAAALARRVGRGQRSAIGLYGFFKGGLLFEGGKTPSDEISPLVARVELPEAWRFVLVRPRGQRGLSGAAERKAFARLPPVPPERTAALGRLAAEALLPAAAAGRFDEFSESLYRFGYEAGLSFAARQGGAFAGARLTALVQWIHDLGVRGVGQSSWGPTLLALLPSADAAAEFLLRLRRSSCAADLELTITAPANRGASIAICRV